MTGNKLTLPLNLENKPDMMSADVSLSSQTCTFTFLAKPRGRRRNEDKAETRFVSCAEYVEGMTLSVVEFFVLECLGDTARSRGGSVWRPRGGVESVPRMRVLQADRDNCIRATVDISSVR
jgi:hypothetical protein